MTITEARQQLERARDAAPEVLRGTIAALGQAAVPRLAGASPRDTGEFAASWVWSDPVLANTAPYAPYVHDGLAYRMVPAVLEELQPAFETDLAAHLDAVAGWGR